MHNASCAFPSKSSRLIPAVDVISRHSLMQAFFLVEADISTGPVLKLAMSTDATCNSSLFVSGKFCIRCQYRNSFCFDKVRAMAKRSLECAAFLNATCLSAL